MPSFLNDDNAPVYSPNSAVVHLDPSGPYGIATGKVNGDRPSAQSHHSNDTFGDDSSRSARSSLRSASPSAEMNGDVSDATTMSAAVDDAGPKMDGAAAAASTVSAKTDIPRKPLPNGNAVSSAPPTPLQPPPPPPPPPPPLTAAAATNGAAKDSESTSTSPREAQPRTSVASTRASSVQTSPVEMYIRQVNKGDVVTVDSGLSRKPSNAPAPSSSLSPPTTTAASTPDPNATRNQNSPHRFSSPPQYHGAGGAGSSSTTSASLQPPGGGLKHRHTLEVPKLAPSRASRDGIDAAMSTGRFSPTMATTPGGRRASLSLVRRNTRSMHSELPRDEVVPDEDALRWAEAYRQKRASKRKRMGQEDDDRVLVGTKVDESHANWVTAYNMLTGIRVSVSRTNAKLDRPLTDADFEAKQKSTFDITGNELVPSAKYDFKFKDYAPWVFRHLRALFHLDPADYLVSLTGKYILSELGSPGKSGSFFYFSRDYKYIIKTIHHAEHKFLRKILKDYYEHVTENPNTLLSQFYGLHRVKIPYGKKIHFVVMNNLFPPHRDIHHTYDLKGSTIGRDYREEDLAKNPRATLKDLNWLRRHERLELGLEKKRRFLDQLHKDVRLLQRLQIMDYSLLIGIHDVQKGNEENLRSKTLQVFNVGPEGNAPQDLDPHTVLMRTPSKLESQRKARELRQMIKAERPVPIGESDNAILQEFDEGHSKDSIFYKDDGGYRATHEDNSPGEEIYYLGVIDCLTHYGIIKKIEHFWKGLHNDKTQISAQPPLDYGERFLNFMSGITKSSEEAAREEHEREQAAAAASAAAAAAAAASAAAATTTTTTAEQEKGKGKERVGSWSGSLRRRSITGSAPPIPNYQPPPPPSAQVTSGHMSPEAEEVLRRAEQVAQRSTHSEDSIPDRTLRTMTATAGAIVPAAAVAAASPATASNMKHGPQTMPSHTMDRRESTSQAALPVVEEAGEGSSMGDASRNSRFSNRTMESDGRPLTPAKDGEELGAGFGNPILSHGSRKGRPGGGGGAAANGGGSTPPTPPKSSYLKPESADSGYGVSGGRSRSGTAGSGAKVKVQLSRESLDKALPPLPPLDGGPA